MTSSPYSSITTLNESAAFWFYDIGVNVILADTKNKITSENWSQWKDKFTCHGLLYPLA
jgi:hypothetical protein